MAEDLKELTRTYVDQVWNRGKLELVDELVAPGCRTHDPAAPGGVYAGPEGVKQLVGMYRSAFPDTEFELTDLIEERDKVAARITATGTHKGTLMGIAPTSSACCSSSAWCRPCRRHRRPSSFSAGAGAATAAAPHFRVHLGT